MVTNEKKLSPLLKYISIIGITVLLVLIAGLAWAKYISYHEGMANANVAQFNFRLKGDSTDESGKVIFATTRDSGNDTVAEGMLAPGTSGKFDICIDASGSQTFLEYTLRISFENKPENLKLYYNEAKTQEIIVEENSFIKKGFLSLEDVNTIKTETIYWDWPLQTGTTDAEISANDKLDSKWMDKVMTMNIVATGSQVTKDPLEIAVTDVEGNEVLINRMNVKDYYGRAIKYNENDGNTYRLFYIDYENKYGDGAGTVYLKADSSASNYTKLESTDITNIDKSIFKNLNQQWVIADGKMSNPNEYYSIYLADPDRWSEYKNTTESGYRRLYKLCNSKSKC